MIQSKQLGCRGTDVIWFFAFQLINLQTLKNYYYLCTLIVFYKGILKRVFLFKYIWFFCVTVITWTELSIQEGGCVALRNNVHKGILAIFG